MSGLDQESWQAEFALRDSERESLIVAVKSEETVCVGIHVEGNLSKKLNLSFKINQYIGVIFAGHRADSQQIIEYSRNEALKFYQNHNSDINIQNLVKIIANFYQYPSQFLNKRIFGCVSIVFGVDSKESCIYVIRPSGVYNSFKYFTIGKKNEKANEYLDHYYEENLGFNDLINLTLKSMNIRLICINSSNNTLKECSNEVIDTHLKRLE